MKSTMLAMRRGVAVAASVGFLLAGALAMYLAMRPSPNGQPQLENTTATSRRGAAAPGQPAEGSPRTTRSDADGAPDRGPLPDVVVSIDKETLARAGVVVAVVSTAGAGAATRLPGVIEANAYRQVTVTPLVAGRVTRVAVELGQRVRRGQALAQIYSPELSEAQTRFVSARAMLNAHDRELQRTQKLVDIGAASRQELERIHAQHTAQTAEVQSARARLELLGVPASAIDAAASQMEPSATTSVPAPIDGVVTERLANVGLNVDLGDKLFTVVDLSTVWVVADVYEKDFSVTRIGNEATITTTAYPDLALKGRVSYIDPLVNRDTRTAKVRVEVPNVRNELRLGMYADVILASAKAGSGSAVVPKSAVQNVGSRYVVYLANAQEPERFIEREVRLGQPIGDGFDVVSGLVPGNVVVAEGSFFLRAEAERLGLRSLRR